MQQVPKVSIIIPVYFAEKYLQRCLSSVVNQTLKDIEIICINDGSTDRSLEILKEFQAKDSRMIIIDKVNEGQSIARNLGISKATGEYLGFVDCDDWVDLDFFEKLYTTAKKYNSDIACAGFKRKKKERISIKKSFKKEIICKDIESKILLDKLPDDNYIWNKIYKRENWHFKFEEGRFFEDIALTIKILHYMGDMVTVPNTYYYYRKNTSSTVHGKTEKHRADYEWAQAEQKKFAQEHNIKLKFGKVFSKREYIKAFGLTILKIYHYENTVIYKAFGFIPLFKRITL